MLHDLILLDLLGNMGLAEMNGLMRNHSQEVARITVLIGNRLVINEQQYSDFNKDCHGYDLEPNLFVRPTKNNHYNFTPAGIFLLKVCAKLHDIGKPFFRHSYLLARDLDRDEYEVQKLHANLSRIVIKSMALTEDFEFSHPRLVDFVGDMAAAHQERYDGTGYPDAISGNQIGLVARIMAICDTVGAMLNPRPHKPACDIDGCFEQLERAAGSQFDPALLEQIIAILRSVPDVTTRFNNDVTPCERFSPDFLRFIQLIDFDRIDLKKGDRKRLTELKEVVKLALAHERAIRHESVH